MTAPPVPTWDPESRPYWEALARGELHIQRCRDCGRYQHFPAAICSSCWSFELTFERVSGRGTVETFVVIEHITNPAFADRAPITAAWIELAEQPGLRVFADVVGCASSDVRVGQPVEVVFDHDAYPVMPDRPGPLVLPRFRPVSTD